MYLQLSSLDLSNCLSILSFAIFLLRDILVPLNAHAQEVKGLDWIKLSDSCQPYGLPASSFLYELLRTSEP